MERSPDVRDAVATFVDRFGAGDLAGFDASISADDEAFIIGTQRWVYDRAEWIGNFRALVDKGLVGRGGLGLRIDAGEIRAFGEGAFGWAVAWIAFVFPGGNRLPARFTAILRQEAGDWRIIHAHVSVAVPDEVAMERAGEWLKQLGQEGGT
jgi:ketosteroid isomerase-like protein